MRYKEQLNTENWKAKRYEIFKRDSFKCKVCGNKKNIQVHHSVYKKNKMAWEYKPYTLITLCDTCHVNTHKNKISITNILSRLKSKYMKAERLFQQSVKKNEQILIVQLSMKIDELNKRITELEKEVFELP